MLEGIKNWKRRREDKKEEARRTAVKEFAAASGLSYSSYPSYSVNVSDKLKTVSIKDVLFRDGSIGGWPGLAENMTNMLSGRWQGLPVAEADFLIHTIRFADIHRGDKFAPLPMVPFFEEKHFSAVIADLPAALPELMIQRTLLGLGHKQALLAPRYHIESGFDREWWVTTANTAFAAKLIDASMITWLLSARNAFIFKLYGRNLLLVWSYLLPAPGLGAIFDTAKSFTDHIPRQVWAEYGTR